MQERLNRLRRSMKNLSDAIAESERKAVKDATLIERHRCINECKRIAEKCKRRAAKLTKTGCYVEAAKAALEQKIAADCALACAKGEYSVDENDN